MPKARPISQQRKRRVRISKSSPFPVPIETVTGESASNGNWFYYTASLQDSGVVVKHSGDMDFLYKMGFFGKGSMSRGQPQWSEHWRVVTLPQQQTDRVGQQSMLRAKVTSRRRYMTHLGWRLMSEGNTTGLETLQKDQQWIITEDSRHNSTNPQVKILDHVHNQDCSESETAATIMQTSLNDEEFSEAGVDDVDMKELDKQRDWEEEEGDEDFWGAEQTSVLKKSSEASAATWDSSAPGDEDFWGAETVSTSDSKLSHSTHPTSHSIDPASHSTDSTSLSTDPVSHSTDSRSHSIYPTSHSTYMNKSEKTVKLSSSESNISKQLPSKDESSVSDGQKHIPSAQTNSEAFCDSGRTAEKKTSDISVSGGGDNDEKYSLKKSLPERLSTLNEDHPTGNINSNCNAIVEQSGSSMSCDNNENEQTNNENTPGGVDSRVEWSRFCESSDTIVVGDGNTLFVVQDSDDDEPLGNGTVCRTKTRWKPAVKRDPFPVKENLHLSYEEAYFLSYGLGCLSVLDSQQIPMDLDRMWREFCQRQPNFLPNYIAYHYYRSKNWVPKTGLKFGCTFLLYKDGPPFYHGSYSVVVKFVDMEGKQVEGFEEQRQFSWTSLAGLKRITEHVGKELMFCYVIKPTNMTADEMLSPKCVPHFQVKEMLVSRWVSSQEREGKALEEMP